MTTVPSAWPTAASPAATTASFVADPLRRTRSIVRRVAFATLPSSVCDTAASAVAASFGGAMDIASPYASHHLRPPVVFVRTNGPSLVLVRAARPIVLVDCFVGSKQSLTLVVREGLQRVPTRRTLPHMATGAPSTTRAVDPTDPRARSIPAVATDAQLVVTTTPNRFHLVVDVDGVTECFTIAGRPALRRSTAWERSVRRVHHVDLCRLGDGWRASIHVTGHRLPSCRAISVGTALALGLRGHRLVVCPHTLAEGADDGRLPL